MYAFVLGAALIALWIDVRLPRLAPASLSRRALAALAAMVALQATPVLAGSAAALYATLFGILLPVLVFAFLAGIWLLRSLQEPTLTS